MTITPNSSTSGTPTQHLTALLERPWEDLSFEEQQACILQSFSPAEWLTNDAVLVGVVLRQAGDRPWYAWKALAKERGVDTYGYEKAVDEFIRAFDIPRVTPAGAPPAPTPARRRAVRITAQELKAKQLPPLTYVVEEILPAGCTLFTGKSKDGKSFAAYDLTVAVASGGKALGRYNVTQGSVWYLALEDGERRAKERLAMIEDRLEEDLPDEVLDKIGLTLWEAPRLGEGLEEELTDWITTTPDARLVIIDILEKVRPPRKVNGNNYAQDYEPTAKLTQLAQDHNVAILVIHHANKLNPTDFRDSASGCMSLIGGADNFWSLSRLPMSEDATLKITGRDIRHEQDLAMQFKDGYWTALGEAKLVVMSRERQQVVEVLQQQARPLTPKQIARALEKNYNTIKILLRKMLDAHIVIQPTDGHYALSPSYLSTTINPINPINPVNPVNPVNPERQGEQKQEDSAKEPPRVPDPGWCEGGETVYGGFTRVYGGFTADEMTQPIEKTELNDGTVYGFTGFTGVVENTSPVVKNTTPPDATAPLPATDCHPRADARPPWWQLKRPPQPCPGCGKETTWIIRGQTVVCANADCAYVVLPPQERR
jgi:hypothetical protein